MDMKGRIRRLLSDVLTIAREEPQQEQMADALLSSAISALAAIGGSITTLSENGQITPCHMVNRNHYSKMPTEFARFRRNAIKLTWETSSPQCFEPDDESDAMALLNPSQQLMLYLPLKHADDEMPTAVMEIMQRPTVGPATRRGMMRFSTEMCDNVSKHFRFKNDD